MKKKNGITFIELLLVISVSALLLGISAPNLRDYFVTQQANTDARQIVRHLQKARELAVFSGREITFCGVDQEMKCTRDDIKRLVIFFDTNKNQRVDAGEKIESELHPSLDGTLYLRTSLGPNHITYANDGRASVLGSLYLCPANGDQTLIRRVSINRPGRAYIARASPNGLVVKTDGSAINCASL